METAIGDAKTKEIMKQAILELLQDRQSEFRRMILDAMEEIGLANAIREGRQNDFVDEEEIMAILEE